MPRAPFSVPYYLALPLSSPVPVTPGLPCLALHLGEGDAHNQCTKPAKMKCDI